MLYLSLARNTAQRRLQYPVPHPSWPDSNRQLCMKTLPPIVVASIHRGAGHLGVKPVMMAPPTEDVASDAQETTDTDPDVCPNAADAARQVSSTTGGPFVVVLRA